MFRTARVGRDVHVVPVADSARHRKGRQCPCGPRFEDADEYPAWEGDDASLVVIHRAFDGRPEDDYQPR